VRSGRWRGGYVDDVDPVAIGFAKGVGGGGIFFFVVVVVVVDLVGPGGCVSRKP
jgi:hypothetical protein